MYEDMDQYKGAMARCALDEEWFSTVRRRLLSSKDSSRGWMYMHQLSQRDSRFLVLSVPPFQIGMLRPKRGNQVHNFF